MVITNQQSTSVVGCKVVTTVESTDLFNNRPDDINLHQAWLFAEKSVSDESPLGFRADLIYGIDGADTQSFGNDPGTFDFQNGFDHGRQSWAIPQLYGEAQLGEWNVKAGHFYTLVGYEVVTAPDNFFYSHAITFFNTEPFTHTGVVTSRDIGEDITFYGGWTAGWDTGFDQFGGGSNWLGGASFQLTENSSLTYISTAGDFGARGSDAYSHSFVYDTQLSDKLNWVVQSDLLRVNSTGEDNVGLNQYLLYTVNDCLGFGARMEWWKGDVLTGYAPHGGDVANSVKRKLELLRSDCWYELSVHQPTRSFVQNFATTGHQRLATSKVSLASTRSRPSKSN